MTDDLIRRAEELIDLNAETPGYEIEFPIMVAVDQVLRALAGDES